MATLAFDDRNITWRTIDGFDHIAYHILSVNVQHPAEYAQTPRPR